MDDRPPAGDGAFGLATYLLTSARGCMDEPKLYGSLRLVEAISRLASLAESSGGFAKDEFLLRARAKIDANKHLVMESDEQFREFLDGLLREFTQELKRRNGID